MSQSKVVNLGTSVQVATSVTAAHVLLPSGGVFEVHNKSSAVLWIRSGDTSAAADKTGTDYAIPANSVALVEKADLEHTYISGILESSTGVMIVTPTSFNQAV